VGAKTTGDRIIGGAHAGVSRVARLDARRVVAGGKAGDADPERQLAAIGGIESRLGANRVGLRVNRGQRGVEIDVEIAPRAPRFGERAPASVAQSRVAARRAAIDANVEATRLHADLP
jgi:hypothetical protein